MTSNITTDNENWTKIIRPRRGWFELHLGELWRFRELIMLFVWRDFVAAHKQTVLGPLWYVIQPILSTVMYTIVFNRIARLSTDGLPPFLFYLSSTTIWTYFTTCLTTTSTTFNSSAQLFSKVYFPRLSVPISIVISNLVSFFIRLAVLIMFVIYYAVNGAPVHPTMSVLLLPVLLLIMAGFGMGLGITISSLTTKYRDLHHLVAVGVQLFMYATPVIYPLSSIEGVWRNLLLLNPMTAVVETFRLALLGTSTLDPVYLYYSFGFMVVVFFMGVLIFNRAEATFTDTV